MIKDVMVCLDGSAADELRLAAVADVARLFDSHVIGLFLNPLPVPAPAEADVAGAALAADLRERAKEAGDRTEAILANRLARLNAPVEIRRFDILADDVANIAAREARSADTFVALRPNGSQDPERLVEGTLFGSGRHLLLVPEENRPKPTFDRILVAWNGSRESARALAEAMPYLHKAKEVRRRHRRRPSDRATSHAGGRRGPSSRASWDRRSPASCEKPQWRYRSQADRGGGAAQSRPDRHGGLWPFPSTRMDLGRRDL
jgi:hypothetical protein